MENITFYFDRRPDMVIKFARQVYLRRKHLMDKEGTNATRDRVDKNLGILRNYIDEEFLPETKTRSFGDIWWTEQERLPVDQYVSSENIGSNPLLIPQVINVIEQAEKMYEDTGYYIDWFGFNRIDEIIKLLLLPGYWSIPNLVITDARQLKLFDMGLYGDKRVGKDMVQAAVSPIVDSGVCRLQRYLIGKVLEKSII